MLPEDPVVLLVDAHGVLDDVRRAVLAGEDGIEVGDLPEAVTAQSQRVGQAAQAPLADVEGVLPPVHGVGVAVGHDHLADRGAAQDGTEAPVVVADAPQDQSLERLHRDPHGPVLPREQIAVEVEAGPVRLDDLQGAEAAALGLVVLGQVAAAPRGERHHTEVHHLEDLAPGGVHGGQDTLDRPGVAVVGRLLAVVREAPGDPATLLEGIPEVAGGPGVDLDLLEVGDAAATHGLLPLRVVPQRQDGPVRVVEQEGRPHPLPGCPLDDLTRGQRHHDLHHGGFGTGDDDQADPALDGVPGTVGRHRVPARLVQGDHGEEGPLVDLSALPHRGHRGPYLVGGQRIERVRGRRRHVNHGPSSRSAGMGGGWSPPPTGSLFPWSLLRSPDRGPVPGARGAGGSSLSHDDRTYRGSGAGGDGPCHGGS